MKKTQGTLDYCPIHPPIFSGTEGNLNLIAEAVVACSDPGAFTLPTCYTILSINHGFNIMNAMLHILLTSLNAVLAMKAMSV